MKRYLPLVLVLLLLLVGVIYLARRSPVERRFDSRLSLRREDRIPYGTFLARDLLPKLFPKANVYNEPAAPGHWDSLSTADGRQALFLMGYYIDADNDEVTELLRFAARGNYVYLVGVDFSRALCDALSIEARRADTDRSDTMSVALEAPRFAGRSYHYPGEDMSGLLIRNAPDSTVLLGTRDGGRPNFLQFRIGGGSIFVHSSPLAFSNYFLLQPGNEAYLAGALSVLPSDLRRVAWSEYYLSKDANGDDDDGNNSPNWLRVLLRYRAFSWALGLMLLLLLLYALSEMRRRQRWIPPHEQPRNESLDFVQTVGRLYYDQRDHHDLAVKMIQYFLDHVRQQYKIPTSALDEEFIRRLEARSGYPRAELERLLALIGDIRALGRASESQLADLHQQLENYYQYG
ncbi:MAG: hypothetical protein EOO12_10580 [Chitinophagaceae bacterium]|nr:MAG: hypothetical protein EOO12_10580 [Chitinophagaceae bacterium]